RVRGVWLCLFARCVRHLGGHRLCNLAGVARLGANVDPLATRAGAGLLDRLCPDWFTLPAGAPVWLGARSAQFGRQSAGAEWPARAAAEPARLRCDLSAE